MITIILYNKPNVIDEKLITTMNIMHVIWLEKPDTGKSFPCVNKLLDVHIL